MASTSSLAASLGHGNLVYDSFTCAAIGGSSVALFFLLIDAVSGTPLHTPSLLGSVLFRGMAPESVVAVSLDMVAAYTALHFAIFGIVGFAAAFFAHAAERSADPILTLLLGFVAFEVGFVAVAWVLMPGVIETLGWANVAISNLLAAGGMTYYLLRIRPRIEWHEDSP